MQFSIYMNQVKAIEWGLNLQQSALFAFLYELPSWADEVIINGRSYRWISKSKIINELPILTSKPDTIKKQLQTLEDLNLIERKVVNKVKLCIRITEKGRLWNRDIKLEVVKKIPMGGEKNPHLPGEKNPPNQITNNQITNINNNTVSDDTVCDDFWLKIRNIYKKYNFKPGNKQQALSVFKKLKLNESQIEELIKKTESHLLNKRKILDSGEFVSNPPHIVRWIKHRAWEDELDVSNKNVKPIVNQQRKIKKF